MYIRRTSTKSRRDGAQYYTYRLVESRRTGMGVQQYTLLNLGVDFSLPRAQWPDLTKRIAEILGGQKSLFDIDSDVDCVKLIVDIEKRLKISSSFYFRLKTINLEMMEIVKSAGSEVGYHYEEIATLAKANGWRIER